MLKLVEWQFLKLNVLTVQKNVSTTVPMTDPIGPVNVQIVQMNVKTVPPMIALLCVHQKNVLLTVSTVQLKRPHPLNEAKLLPSSAESIRISTERTKWKVQVAATRHLPQNTAKHITMIILQVFNL